MYMYMQFIDHTYIHLVIHPRTTYISHSQLYSLSCVLVRLSEQHIHVLHLNTGEIMKHEHQVDSSSHIHIHIFRFYARLTSMAQLDVDQDVIHAGMELMTEWARYTRFTFIMIVYDVI